MSMTFSQPFPQPFPQPGDFKDESEALYALINNAPGDIMARTTGFKGWRVEHIIGHLHMWNWAADLSLHDRGVFTKFYLKAGPAVQAKGLRAFEDKWLDGLSGRELLETWREFYLKMAERFAEADPKFRVKWGGPEMSVRSSITARLMETWAHGLAVYDVLGTVRQDHERIKNIAVLGVNTFGWTFINRKLDIPKQTPYVRLTSPSGAVWEWSDPDNGNCVQGDASEFCQVVTQTRNIADTNLQVSGDAALKWMEIAQCFAGPPEDQPAPGTRHCV
ncbi:MAG: TIGR03084 family metal-binding protein [Xanthomonadales bacterium]|nr:TIGR03084 family metal-binding protein [Xanthomonadales bacterium]